MFTPPLLRPPLLLAALAAIAACDNTSSNDHDSDGAVSDTARLRTEDAVLGTDALATDGRDGAGPTHVTAVRPGRNPTA